jgi:hypothetical protein
MRLKLVAPVALCFLSLSLTGCGNVLTPLQLIVDATADALPILQAAGVSVPAPVITYVGDVANCIGQLSGTPTAAQLTAVGTCLTAEVAPQLGGLPGAVVSIVGLVIKDVQAFLTKAPAIQAALVKTSLTQAQLLQVASMQTKARTTAAVARSMVVKK